MYDYIQQIEDFIKLQFTPVPPEGSNLKMTNSQILELLFKSFPKDCISDYELNDIMLKLKFQRHTYTEKITDKPYLVTGWCIYSPVIADELFQNSIIESE